MSCNCCLFSCSKNLIIVFPPPEGKTDYYARRRLVIQDKTKYNSPKYRLVVRIVAFHFALVFFTLFSVLSHTLTCKQTNKDVVCQIVSSTIRGDVVHTAAYAHELPRYGIKVGLTNYAAVYATGLLLGRRHLQKLGLDKKFAGTQTTGEAFLSTEEVEGNRPFKCFLDVGLTRTTTGARVFAGLKGAVDAGLNIPHSESRFPGWNKDDKKLDLEVFRKYLFGGHVAAYMESLAVEFFFLCFSKRKGKPEKKCSNNETQEDDEEAYQKQFSKYIANGIAAGSLADLYKAAHQKIRADPSPAAKKPAKESKNYRNKKTTLAQRKDRIRQILASRAAAVGDAQSEDDEEDDE